MKPTSAPYEKPAKRKQWRECADTPIIDRPMSIGDIEHFRQLLARSYFCPLEEITWELRKIHDDDLDDDRDDFLWLKYKCKIFEDGKTFLREVFTIKLPIPADVKAQSEELRRRQAAGVPTQRRPVRALPAPSGAHITPAPTLEPEEPARPRLRQRNVGKK